MLKRFLLYSALLIMQVSYSQTVYVTSIGGSFPTEKWMSITTGPNGTGTLVWEQSNLSALCGTENGNLVNDVSIDLSAYCGGTLYVNAYDSWADSWDGTIYEIWTAAGQNGSLLANNGGLSPTNGLDTDASSDFCDTQADELEVSEAFTVPTCPCAAPSATYTIVPDCGNGQFSIDVNVSNTGDATFVDISVGATTYETGVNTGSYTIGPFAAGSSNTVNVDGTSYTGCATASSPLTENCICTNAPVATVNAINLDCNAQDYDIEVTVTSFGDGTSADILIDGVSVQASATLNNLYTFTGYATGSHTVKIEANGGAFVTCETDYATSLTCNGSELCSGAPDITNDCSAGDLTTATVDGGALVENYMSCGNGNTIALCGANSTFTGSSYTRTDHADIWYKVFPNGSNTVTVTISNLSGGNLMVLPYLSSGACPSLASDNATMEGHIINGGITGGNCPYFSADGSLVLSGADVATASVIYLRIMAYANNGSGATNCQTLTYPTFDICTSVPQANDICSDAIDIDNASSTGNFCSANTDVETVETCNIGSGCLACTESSETNDLWYSVTMDPSDPDQFLELDLTFTNASDAVVVTLYAGCFSNSQMDDGGIADCATVSSTGANSTVTHRFNSTITAGGFGPDWYVRVAPASGNSVCGFDVLGRRVAENNDCSVMQNVFPGFDLASAQNVDYNFATDSGADPVTAGSDLWYQFDPNSGTDNGIPVYSTSADITVAGLTAGQELSVLVYEGNIVSSDNCTNLSQNYLGSIDFTSNTTLTFNCLSETHGPAHGGYLVRIVQTSGTTATPTVSVNPSTAGKFNNTCDNIFNGTSPINLGVSDLAHQFNLFYILDGETVTGNFTGTTDCDDDITSSVCSGVANDPVSLANYRDLWYIFRVPDDNCPDLTMSSVINDMTFTYDASSAFRDAKLYVYTACGDANLIACSGTLDGGGDSYVATGLTQGEYYLLRIKPSHLNSDFDYSFDLTVNNGNIRPCNNEGSEARSLNVNSCNDYDNLETWSMRGANESPLTGVPENDVWFTFTAPSPANGGPYFVANMSWVTVFLENVSGTSTAPLYIELYAAPTAIVATATSYGTGTAAGSQAFAHFGNLNPGQTYYLRAYHKEGDTDEVDYKINVYTPNANETAWECGSNNSSLTSGCSEGCNDLREAYFKIDLPVGTPSNQYYMIEVVGYDQILDFELRSQYLTESAATQGDFEDYDHPCSSRPLEPGVSISSEFTGITTPVTGESCNPNGIAADGGEGVRRVYFGMNGPAAGMKDYYYIRVFMDPSDPNYTTTTGLNVCAINFNGPYTTELLAEGGGLHDGGCTPVALGAELTSFNGVNLGVENKISWETESELNNSHFVLEHSMDGIVFSPIATVDGNGTTTLSTDYRHLHRVSNPLNYYRLKQFDFDGTIDVSEVIAVESEFSKLKMYPSPASQGEYVVVHSEDPITSIEVRALNGKLLQKLDKLDSNSQLIQGLHESGVYFVTVYQFNKSKTLKLIVK